MPRSDNWKRGKLTSDEVVGVAGVGLVPAIRKVRTIRSGLRHRRSRKASTGQVGRRAFAAGEQLASAWQRTCYWLGISRGILPTAAAQLTHPQSVMTAIPEL